MLVVIAAFSFWKLTPKKFNEQGNKITGNYVSMGQVHETKALESLSQGDSGYAEKLLKDWEDIGTGDRYYKYKRNIMLSLSKHLLEKGDYQKVADFIHPSLLENDRDIMLFIEWAKAGLNLPEFSQTAERDLTVMAKRFPDHDALNILYIRDVLHKGDEAAGLAALSQLTGLTPKTGGWSVLWKLESNTKYEKRVWRKLKSDGPDWSLDLTVPKTATMFRVDPPPNVRMDISNIRITSKGESLGYEVTSAVEINMLQVKGASLSAQGLDNPYFVVTAPNWLSTPSNEGELDVKVTFSLTNIGLNTLPNE